jgi:hypothetical protein
MAVVLFVTAFFSPRGVYGQALPSAPPFRPPPPFSTTPTAAQEQALKTGATSARIQRIQAVITPKLHQAIQSYQQSAEGNSRTWQDLIFNGTPQAKPGITIQFSNSSTGPLAAAASLREYYPVATTVGQTETQPSAIRPYPSIRHPVPWTNPDQDGDGLPDIAGGLWTNPVADLETPLAKAFMPIYFISRGEQQQFATFDNYVPWTVVTAVGTNPPDSYYHVTPLGLTTDKFGNPFFAVRVDYLSPWNADGGLIGGGAACFYSYFGPDDVISEISGYVLDAERSVMLLAAPAVNGNYNPDPNAYSLYSLYTAAHEGTVFDQSQFADFPTPVPAGNHVNLAQSLSKHSTYGFNPDYYPITPSWFIGSVIDDIETAYLDEEIDLTTYEFLIAAADDTFYGCLVERFGKRDGGLAPSPTTNVGEISHPLNGRGFIQDDASRALHLADKLSKPVF